MRKYDQLRKSLAEVFADTAKSIKLKNQFRTLHEDEVDFLDQVLESTRARDASVQKETLEQLENFRMQRENAEKAARQSEGEDGDDVRWAPTTGGGRKRKKGKDKATVPGIKYRKSSSTRDEISYEKQESFKEAVKSDLRGDKESKQVKLEGPRVGQGEGRELGSTSTPSLGLAAYSDEE